MAFKTLKLHIGIHKTGTTSIQNMLQIHRGELKKNGVYYVPRRKFRNAFQEAVGGIGARAFFAEERFREKLAPHLPKGQYDLIISEENIVGTMRKNLTSKRFYSGFEENLRITLAAIDHEKLEIFIGLRSYASYYNSVYAFRSTGNDLRPFDEYKPNIYAQEKRILSLIERARKLAPNSNIYVWDQQGMRGQEDNIFNTMTNHALPQAHYEIDRNLGLSARAVREMQQIWKDHGRRPNGSEVTAARQKFPITRYAKPNYWSKSEAYDLHKEYMREIKAIIDLEGVHWLGAFPSIECGLGKKVV